MEFTARKSDLLRELGLSQRIVEKRNTIPILANILIEADKEGVSLTATDLEVGLKNHCPATVKAAGAITVSAKKLFEIVRSLPEEDVRIRSNDALGISIICGRAEFKLVGLDSKDFPNLPACDFKGGWEASTDLVRELLSKVLFAVTSDEARFPIAGLLFLASKKNVTLVATDGHRLAVAEAEKGLKGIAAETRVVMPKKALVEVRQMTELGEAKVACEVKDNHIYFRIADRTLVARMVEDQFPAYEKVIPRANDKHISLSRLELDGAVRRASVLSNDKNRAVKLQFRDGRLTVSASNPELGEVHEDIPIDYRGEEIEIAFNAQYLLDFLAILESDRLIADLKDGATQALLRPDPSSSSSTEGETKSAKEVQHYYVLMPMRL